jgi:HAE1 family hydrophobic/amphiphilic exporter-1
VQLPDGASLERTQRVLDRVSDIAHKTSGVAQVITIAGLSVLDNNSTLANSGVAYVVLKPWSERGSTEDLRSLFLGLNASLGVIEEARTIVLPPPPIQGVGNAAGATMQIELRDSSFDLAKLQATVDAFVANASSQSSLQRIQATFRSNAPQFTVEVDRVKAQTLHVSVDQVFSALSGFLGSGYVDQFNKFGRTFQIYIQADSQYRMRLEDINNMAVRNSDGSMIPLGTLVTITPTVGASLIRVKT